MCRYPDLSSWFAKKLPRMYRVANVDSKSALLNSLMHLRIANAIQKLESNYFRSTHELF
jgi:hypothetical protein